MTTTRFPLSVTQQSLWFAIQLHEDDFSYNLPFALHVDGELDVAALRDACRAVVERHTQLRVRVAPTEAGIFQEVLPISEELLAGVFRERGLLPEDDLAALLREESSRPFELDRGPLVRFILFRRSAGASTVQVVVHHLVFDGVSQAVLLRDLSHAYASARGEFVEPQSPPPAYAAFVKEEPKPTEREIAHLEALRATIPEGLPLVQLPGDRPAARRGARGAAVMAHLEGDLKREIQRLASEAKTTPFVVFLAAYFTLLRRYGNAGPLCVTVAMNGRPRAFRDSVGLFVNLVPIVILDAGPQASFSDVLASTAKAVASAVGRRRTPLARTVEVLAPPRSCGGNPLFQVVMGYSDFVPEAPSLGAATTSVETLVEGGTKADLSLEILDHASFTEVKLEGPASRFDVETVERMMGHLRTLLRAVTAHPTQLVGSLPVLTGAERRQLLEEWNATAAPFPSGATVHGLVAETMNANPDRLAVTDCSTSLTYSELGLRAKRLTGHIQELGVRRGDVVAVCLPRGVDLAIALLAVLDAGAAYVPLDAGYPPERLAYVVNDAAPSALITETRLLDRLPIDACPVVCVDRELDDVDPSERKTGGPTDASAADDAAYVIYTSGSTGRPKGSVVTHRSLVNLITWHQRAYRVGVDDRASLLASVGFDASAWELWPYLTSGASVHAPDEEIRQSPELLWTWLAAARVTITYLPTPVAEHLLGRAVPPGGRLRTVLTGGDRLRQYPPEGWGVELVNHYGPTECTVLATAGTVPPRRRDGTDGAPSIGRPVANVEAYVLDGFLHPVPVGVAGELYIGGEAVGQGYLHRPTLTAERFVPNPFSSEHGARLFRTGDLGRFRTDGSIDFLGRADDQVKIRGFRVEPGEVEHVLGEHPGLRQALVAVRDDGGDVRMVAYVVSATDVAPEVADLRDHARRFLPEFMVPTVFVFVDALPLTEHGKVDRHALPAPPPPNTLRLQARNPVEELLVDIWRSVLDVDDVGVTNDFFFDLGGHSLLVVEMLVAVEQAFHRRPTVAAFFERGRTVEQLARLLGEQNKAAGMSPQLVEVRRTGSRPPLFFVHPSEAGALTLRHFTTSLGPGQPLFGLLPECPDGRFDRTGSVESLAAGLVRTLRAVQPEGPYHLCGYSFGGILAYEVARQLRAVEEDVRFLALLDAPAPKALQRADHRTIAAWRAWLRLRRVAALGPRDGVATVGRALRRRLASTQPPAPPTPWDDAWLFDVDGAMELAKRYAPSGHDCSLVVFCSWASCWNAGSWSLGWGETHAGPITRHEVQGDHGSMLREPAVHTLAEALAVPLSRVQEDDEASPSRRALPY